jgi:hypothetical protein
MFEQHLTHLKPFAVGPFKHIGLDVGPFPTKLQIAAFLCKISRSETPFLVKYRILPLCFYVKYRVLHIFFVSLHSKYHHYG